MRTTIKYVANDGYEFNTERHCIEHENLLLKIEDAHRLLGKRPEEEEETCNFANGGGYVKHSKKEILAFKKALIALCKKHVGDEVFKLPLNKIHPGGFASRVLSETNLRLYEAWSRLCCIDEFDREWGQPFYALNPHKGTQKPWILLRK